MTLTQRPSKNQKKEDAFISGAPDSVVKPKGIKKGNKQQVSITLAPDLLAKLDEVSSKRGVSRAGFINLAVYHYIDVVIQEMDN